jgi:predicted ATP-dependent serine protease
MPVPTDLKGYMNHEKEEAAAKFLRIVQGGSWFTRVSWQPSIATSSTERRCPAGWPTSMRCSQAGLSTGSTTVLLGPAGVGKSTIEMQFAISAMKAGTKTACYVFDEVIDILVERTEKLCLGHPGGVREYVRSGMLHAQQVDTAEMSRGAFAHEVRRAVDAGAKVIVIDSRNG